MVSPAAPDSRGPEVVRGPAIALASGAGRACRGLVTATACVALSLGWHVIGGGDVPAFGSMVLALAVAGAGSTWWTGRRRGTAALIVLTATVQVALHGLFSAVAGHGHLLAPSPAMIAAHGVAAVGVGWILARGEDTVWAWCGALIGIWAPRLASALPPAVPTIAMPGRVPVEIVPPGVVLARSRPRRGPPVRAVV